MKLNVRFQAEDKTCQWPGYRDHQPPALACFVFPVNLYSLSVPSQQGCFIPRRPLPFPWLQCSSSGNICSGKVPAQLFWGSNLDKCKTWAKLKSLIQEQEHEFSEFMPQHWASSLTGLQLNLWPRVWNAAGNHWRPSTTESVSSSPTFNFQHLTSTALSALWAF